MVKLADQDVLTKEVLGWKGLHVFHFPFSSCSQKLRIFLNLKGAEWESHPVDLMANENLTPWYLGINPRGLVPVLVDDGDVYIESNDIIEYLEGKFPEPKLLAAETAGEARKLLKLEDDMHLDLRALSFRFVFNPPGPPKSADALEVFAKSGSGTVGGQNDGRRAIEIGFWQTYAKEGITDAVAKGAAGRFRQAFSDLDARLATHAHVLDDTLSVADIAWFIYTNRLEHAAYPFARLHPNVWTWYQKLLARPEFSREVMLPPPVAEAFAATRSQHAAEGKSLENLAGF
ncbi:MAG: glutathione S-transferase family protein [Beijerinckiaceae bacterium]